MINADNRIRLKNGESNAGITKGKKNIAINHRTWVLPDGYDELPPKEKQDVLREVCLRYIEKFGPSNAKVVTDGISAPNHETVKKALDYLVATRHLWAESFGGKIQTYMPNGKLGHSSLQGNLKCGNTNYVFRTYADKLSGMHLVINEFKEDRYGNRKAEGGLRLDLVDLDDFIEELAQIRDVAAKKNLIDRHI